MFLSPSVYLSILLFVCLLDYSESCERSFGGVGHGPGNSQLDFGGDPDYDPDPELFLKDFLFANPISSQE